ncbi:MAG: alanine racemase [Candidatus Roizmanbacteria bacterium]
MSDRLTTAYIDLAKYTQNLSKIKSQIGRDVSIMAVVKANAYGHGIIEIAQAAAAQKVRYLGVACLYEARQLREAGITYPIMVIDYIDPDSCDEALDLSLTLTVMDPQVIACLAKLSKKRGQITKVHLKVDTGMHRAGCDPDECDDLVDLIRSSPFLELEGVFTHFANGEDPDQTHMHSQLKLFNSIVSKLHKRNIFPPLIHAANSAAMLTDRSTHFTMVRPGIITYGINPLPKGHPLYKKVSDDFLPILQLTSQIIHIRTLGSGEHIGYGSTYTTTRKSRIALVPIGYGDGLMRQCQSTRQMIVLGKKVPFVGRISMDQCSIDVTDIKAKVGDRVIIIGTERSSHISVSDLANESSTIDYEVLTNIMPRITRCYTW